MSAKQIKARLDKLMLKIQSRKTELDTLRTQAKTLRDELTTARAAEKAKAAARSSK